ncbi:MAG TPA: FAD-dependent oxidoreductase, partial [Actinomycetaceae bacterium]|nr:FAD-dependent oxidoreductase [Actinomycetaceae bacterium]
MDVIIIGGGVCGLALAHQLAPDHDVTVFEASPGPRGGGYMIDFFGPGVAAAERMGVLEELRSRGTLFNGVRWERPDRRITSRIDVTGLVGDSFEGYFSILRPEVELGLLAQLPSAVDLRYGTQVVAVRDADLR